MTVVIAAIYAVMLAVAIFPGKPRECLEPRTVKTIIEVKYRTAMAELDDGTVITVDQGSLRPGMPWCVKYTD